jgi:hypothetical protein
MSKPSTVVSWSTVGTRTEPSSGEKAAGFAPGDRPPASWFNWLWGTLGEWTSYLDNLHNETATFLAANYAWTGVHGFQSATFANAATLNGGALLTSTVEATYSAPRTRSVSVNIAELRPAGTEDLNFDPGLGKAYTITNFGVLPFPINLPDGATLTGATAVVEQGGSTGAMTLSIRRYTRNAGAVNTDHILGSDSAAGIGFDTLTTGAIASNNVHTGGTTYFVGIIQASGGASGAADIIHSISYTFTETRATGNF